MQIWARQRSSIYVHDCLNGFLISVILSYLATHGKINKSLNALDIFRVTLDFIGMLIQPKSIFCIWLCNMDNQSFLILLAATSKLWERGLFFPPQSESPVSKEVRFLLAYQCVLFLFCEAVSLCTGAIGFIVSSSWIAYKALIMLKKPYVGTNFFEYDSQFSYSTWIYWLKVVLQVLYIEEIVLWEHWWLVLCILWLLIVNV